MVATITGLAAGGVVRNAVGADDTVVTLSQEQVMARLSSSNTTSSAQPTSRPSPGPTPTSGTKATQSPTPSGTHHATPPPASQPARTTSPSQPPTAGPSHAPTPAPAPRPTPSSQTGLIYSSGGTVVAECSGSTARIRSLSPAQGYRVASAEYGPAQELELVFAPSGSGSDVEIHITCRNGAPVGEVNNGGHDH